MDNLKMAIRSFDLRPFTMRIRYFEHDHYDNYYGFCATYQLYYLQNSGQAQATSYSMRWLLPLESSYV